MTDVVLSSLTRDVMAKVRKETQQTVDVYGLCGSYRMVRGIVKKKKKKKKKTSTVSIWICAFPIHNKCHLQLLQILK